MHYVGIDFHKRTSSITQMDGRGKILNRCRLTNEPTTLRTFAEGLPAGSKLALEATGNWTYFYELVEDLGLDITLAHPYRTRAIASARIKTDAIDATTLAHLLRTDLLPAAYIPPRAIRDQRELLRYRCALVSLRTRIKNAVHALLAKQGLEPPVTDVFGKAGCVWLRSLALRPSARQALEGYLAVNEALVQQLSQVSQTIRSQATASPDAQRLMTLPGLSFFSALLILAEIGDIHRFPDAEHLCSYAGLVPSVHASGGTTRYGRLTKQGSKYLRWILVELSHHAAQGSVRFGQLFARIKAKHGIPTANVAVARVMLRTIYHMLTDQTDFRDRPIPTNGRTGQRRRGLRHQSA